MFALNNTFINNTFIEPLSSFSPDFRASSLIGTDPELINTYLFSPIRHCPVLQALNISEATIAVFLRKDWFDYRRMRPNTLLENIISMMILTMKKPNWLRRFQIQLLLKLTSVSFDAKRGSFLHSFNGFIQFSRATVTRSLSSSSVVFLCRLPVFELNKGRSLSSFSPIRNKLFD